MQEFRDFLIAIFKDSILDEAMDYLANSSDYRVDAEKGEYRTADELDSLRDNVRRKAEEMSKDFVDELNAKGVVAPNDLNEKVDTLKHTLELYREKFFKWLKEQ